MAVDGLTMLCGKVISVPLTDNKKQHVYVYVAYVPVPYVTVNLRTPFEVEQVVLSQSIVKPYGVYVVLVSIAIDGLNLTHYIIGAAKATHPKHELIHFGLMA
jgi:hypothetical protein